MRRAAQVTFSAAITEVKLEVEDLAERLTKDMVHNRATDWVNERDVDMFKRAVDSFSSLSTIESERKSQKIVFCRHLRELLFHHKYQR